MKASKVKESIKSDSEPVIKVIDGQIAAESIVDDDNYTRSENDYRYLMNGKYFSNGRSFFSNYDSVDKLVEICESLKNKIETKTSNFFTYISSFNPFHKVKTEEKEEIKKKNEIKIQEKKKAILNFHKNEMQNYIEKFGETIDLKNYNYLENSITEFWQSVFRSSLQRSILFVSNHHHEEEKQTTNYVSALAEKAIKMVLEANAASQDSEKMKLVNKVKIKNEDCVNLHYDVDTTSRNVFVRDQKNNHYDIIWKLYPYEWLVDEEFGHLFDMYETPGLFPPTNSTSIADANSNSNSATEPKKISLKLDLNNIYNRNTHYVKKILLRQHLRLNDEELRLQENNKSVSSSAPSSSADLIDSLPISQEEHETYRNKQEEIMKHSLILKTHFLEPAWKLVVSSKALLPALYHRYPGHKNLIPAYYENPYAIVYKRNFSNLLRMLFNNVRSDTENVHTWVIKPSYGREGQNIQVVQKSFLEDLAKKPKEIDEKNKSGSVGEISEKSYLHDMKNPAHAIPVGNNIYQAFSHSEKLNDKYITIGSWTVNGVPSAILVRASDKEILQDENSYFYPHLVHFDNSTNIILHTENKKQSHLRRELYGDEKLKFSRVFGEFSEIYKKFKFLERKLGRSGKQHSHSMFYGGPAYKNASNITPKMIPSSSNSSSSHSSSAGGGKAATGSHSSHASSSS